jgi:glycosyltransferase involved in cell wall biosynthesis
VIAVSPRIRNELLALGLESDKTPLIYNAIVTNNYCPGTYDNGYLRKRFNLKENDILVGNVGRLSPEKGQRVFLDAAKIICHSQNDVYFVLVGDGPDRAALEKYSAEEGIEDRVLFAGYEHDVRPVYQDIDILALTSYTEGFPNVLLESLCMDTPIVATRVGGVEDIVQDGVTGYICEAGDSIGIAASMQRMLDDPEKARAMVSNGKALIRREFQFSTRIEKIQNLYRNVLV